MDKSRDLAVVNFVVALTRKKKGGHQRPLLHDDPHLATVSLPGEGCCCSGKRLLTINRSRSFASGAIPISHSSSPFRFPMKIGASISLYNWGPEIGLLNWKPSYQYPNTHMTPVDPGSSVGTS